MKPALWWVGVAMTDRQRCMLEILNLMGIENLMLSRKLVELLSDIFYSMPYEHRHDEGRLAVQLELGYRLVSAICRAETMDTIASSPALVAQLKKILEAVSSLLPKEVRQTLR